jgi:DNA-binding transcriptional LysR family regulator
METRRLRLFVEIVNSGSISRAATLLGMAQAALSQQLAILENEFKAKLVNRTSTGINVTSAGDSLYREAQIILRQVEHTVGAVRSLSGQVNGHVSIGLTVSTAAFLAVPLLDAMRSHYPHVRLEISDGLSGDLTNRLLHGQIDLASLYRQETRAGITACPVMCEKFSLISSVQCDLGETIRVADLHNLPLLLPSSRQVLRPYYDALFAEHDVQPLIVAESDSITVLKSAVLAGLGSAILPPYLWADELKTGRVRSTRIADANLDRTVWLCRAAQPGNPEVDAVHDLILSTTARLLRDDSTVGLHAVRPDTRRRRLRAH